MEVVNPKSTDLTKDQLRMLSYFNVLSKEEHDCMLRMLEHIAANSIKKRLEAEEKPKGAEYVRHLYGEKITAPKETIQRFGIGVGMVFPGEGDNKKDVLKTRDPRGFPVRLFGPLSNGNYQAYIDLPGRERLPWEEAYEFLCGVRHHKGKSYDRYSGKADALVAAGLVRAEHLPGQPGMRKVRVRIYADGTMPTCHPNANDSRANEAGAKMVSRLSKSLFEVSIVVSKEELERRQAEHKAALEEHEAKLRVMPFPPPLVMGGIPAMLGTSNVFELRVARQSKLG